MTNEIKPALSCDLHDGKITIISLQAFTLNVGPNYFYTAADVDRALAAAQKDADQLRNALRTASMLRQLGGMLPGTAQVVSSVLDAIDAAMAKEKRDDRQRGV